MGDILPEGLIHKILCCLSIEEAAPMMILSKTWLQAWFTNPFLRFQIKSVRDMKKVDKIMEAYRHTKNPVHKFEVTICVSDYPIDFQCLINKWLDIAVRNGVKVVRCENSCAFSFSFPIFTILEATSLTELVVEDLYLPDAGSLSSGLVNCCPLTKLSLSNICLYDNMLKTLLAFCPLIVSLILENCAKLKTIELRNLQKLKSVSISKIYGVDGLHVIIQAPTLEHLSCVGGYYRDNGHNLCVFIHVVDIVECQYLKSLKLSTVRISCRLLEHIISTSQPLESLTLGFLDKELERLLIKSQSLRILEVSDSTGKVAIDAPNLIEYKGQGQIPQLKMPNQLKHSTINLSSCINVNAGWFCELRKFLSNSASLSQVSFSLYDHFVINGQELQKNYHGAATLQVDVLDVHIMSYHEKYDESFVDALLWSCHPRRLNLLSPVKTMTCFMVRLMHMKNPADSSASGSSHWYSRLKQVKAYKFNEQNQPVEFTNLSDWKNKVWEHVKVYFLLDW